MSKAKEFVALIGEVAQELRDQKLEEFGTPDVIQKIATSLFINANTVPRSNSYPARAGGNKPVNSSSWQTLTGVVQEKEKKQLDGDNGKYWKFALKVDGQWLSTFNAKVFAGQAIEEGDTVKVSYSVNGKYKNLEKVEAVGSSSNSGDLEQGEECPF